jgi:hypothetical protein
VPIGLRSRYSSLTQIQKFGSVLVVLVLGALGFLPANTCHPIWRLLACFAGPIPWAKRDRDRNPIPDWSSCPLRPRVLCSFYSTLYVGSHRATPASIVAACLGAVPGHPSATKASCRVMSCISRVQISRESADQMDGHGARKELQRVRRLALVSSDMTRRQKGRGSFLRT